MSPQEDDGTLQVDALPASWFDRKQYRPRIDTPSGPVWFLLDPAFAPPRRVPSHCPPEPAGGRAMLHRAFEQTYEAWGLPRRTETNRSLSVLREEGSAVIVTGQQPGFLGGPLLTLYKALTAVAAARTYRALTGRHCVPVFWVAAEDHDLDEVRNAHFPAGSTFRFPADADRRPLSDYPVEGEALEVLDAAIERVAARRRGERARELLELYRGRGLAGGFAALMAELLGHTGLLLVDPARLRLQAKPIFRRAVEHPEEILACVEKGRRDVQARGIKPLVAARLPLFVLIDGRRHHLSVGPAGLKVDGGGPALSPDRIYRMVHESPELFSAGALLRPLVQQATLPCVLTVGGPAEVGYFAQLGPLADYVGVPRPAIALRMGATLVEGKLARFARSLKLERVAAAQEPEDLLRDGRSPASLEAIRGLVPRLRDVLLEAVEEVAETGEAPKLRTRGEEIARGLHRFADRVEKAHTRRKTREVETAGKLWDFIFPSGSLQERWWCQTHFLARHGTGWIEKLLDELAPDPLRVAHRWITFD